MVLHTKYSQLIAILIDQKCNETFNRGVTTEANTALNNMYKGYMIIEGDVICCIGCTN